MSKAQAVTEKMSQYRWHIVALLFVATTINYLDRQVLSLTWKDFIAPEFHWTNTHYGTITSLFSLFYAFGMLFAGKFIDWLDTKKGFMWAIFIWSIGAVLHAFAGIATSGIITGNWFVGFEEAREIIGGIQNVSRVLNVSVVLFIFARLVLALGCRSYYRSIGCTGNYSCDCEAFRMGIGIYYHRCAGFYMDGLVAMGLQKA